MSERVLYEWVGERALRIVQDDFGFRCQVLNRDGDWLPTTAWEDEWLPEFNALAARVSELELDREERIRSSDCDKALIEKLEDENERLRDEVDRQTKAKECYEERQARKEAENTKLRKCVEAGDHYINSIYSITSNTGLLHAEWSEKIDYYAARAEVDNG